MTSKKQEDILKEWEREPTNKNVKTAEIVLPMHRPALVALVGSVAGKSYILSDELFIGRGSDAAIKLSATDISRHHARVWRDGKSFYLKDLNSTNGTMVDGVPVSSEPQKLRPGNRIQLGAETVLMLTHHSPLESQLVEQQKLEAVGRLAGGVAEEFERLVASARKHVAALKMDAQSDLKASVLRNRLGEIERHMDDALDLTQQMLSFSSSGKQEEMQIDIGDLINSVVRLARHTTSGEVRFETDIIPDLFVLGDPPQLQQVLMGLCIYARDAVDEGRVTISARHWDPADSVTLRPQVMSTTHVRISVRDNGPGIDPEACSRIFEPYFTSRNSNRKSPSLAAVYAVVKHHNGHIECISAPDEGTTFNVFLPIASEKQSSAPTRKAVPAVDGLSTKRHEHLFDEEDALGDG